MGPWFKMVGVLMARGKEDTHMHTGRMLCGHEDRV